MTIIYRSTNEAYMFFNQAINFHMLAKFLILARNLRNKDEIAEKNKELEKELNELNTKLPKEKEEL